MIYEPDARLLLTRSLTPPQKGIVAGVFAGTVWPRDRPRNAGYDAECELCAPDLGHSDSLHHRLWLCPHPTAVAARALAACPDGTLDAARTADFSDPNCVFTLADASLTRRLGRARGALRKRFSCWPTTTAHADEVCYVGGACYPHVVPSLARVGWVGVFFAHGKVTAIASALVWHPAIQSSGVAEWTAMCGIV